MSHDPSEIILICWFLKIYFILWISYYYYYYQCWKWFDIFCAVFFDLYKVKIYPCWIKLLFCIKKVIDPKFLNSIFLCELLLYLFVHWSCLRVSSRCIALHQKYHNNNNNALTKIFCVFLFINSLIFIKWKTSVNNASVFMVAFLLLLFYYSSNRGNISFIVWSASHGDVKAPPFFLYFLHSHFFCFHLPHQLHSCSNISWSSINIILLTPNAMILILKMI